LHADRYDTLVFLQRPLLLGAADVGDVRSSGEQRYDHVGAVDAAFDRTAPYVAGGKALRVEPSIKALCEVYVQALGQFCAVIVGVGEEDARL
jgi:hypothetical protein